MAFVQRSLQFKFQLGTGSFGDSGGASTKIVSNVRASVRIEKKGAPGMNSASMRISGLTASTMNQLSRIGVMPNAPRNNIVTVMAGDSDLYRFGLAISALLSRKVRPAGELRLYTHQ